jgi:class 3 adenylate cyclase
MQHQHAGGDVPLGSRGDPGHQAPTGRKRTRTRPETAIGGRPRSLAAEQLKRLGKSVEYADMDIAVWLRNLGLGRYEQAFRDNEINESVLPKLTAEDQKELGVVAIGHRRTLLDAITSLRAGTVVENESSARSLKETTTQTRYSHSEAERRQLTIAFIDLLGSTALSSRLDPEDLREVIGAYHKCVAEIVSRFDGFVTKYMGDGVLTYFGYPQAHEDEAERAVRWHGLDYRLGARRQARPPSAEGLRSA